MGYMVSSTLIAFRSYWPREGKAQLGIWSALFRYHLDNIGHERARLSRVYGVLL